MAASVGPPPGSDPSAQRGGRRHCVGAQASGHAVRDPDAWNRVDAQPLEQNSEQRPENDGRNVGQVRRCPDCRFENAMRLLRAHLRRLVRLHSNGCGIEAARTGGYHPPARPGAATVRAVRRAACAGERRALSDSCLPAAADPLQTCHCRRRFRVLPVICGPSKISRPTTAGSCSSAT